MIRGWYHNRKNGQRLLSIDEIAEACCVSDQEVRQWLADKIIKSEQNGPDLVDAAEVVWFLVRNSMPVSSSLLPPKTKKILFVASDEGEFQDKCDKFDEICKFFASNCNILVETAIAGRVADLSIVTFSPNLVVIFFKSYRQDTICTLNLLSSFPEQKAILFVDDSIKKEVEHELGRLPTHQLIISDALPVEQIIPQLRAVFDN